jgi:hypothetical protein
LDPHAFPDRFLDGDRFQYWFQLGKCLYDCDSNKHIEYLCFQHSLFHCHAFQDAFQYRLLLLHVDKHTDRVGFRNGVPDSHMDTQCDRNGLANRLCERNGNTKWNRDRHTDPKWDRKRDVHKFSYCVPHRNGLFYSLSQSHNNRLRDD